jgi:hypothetical protein
MYIESWFWLICPLMFFGMMVLCAIFSRRRGRRPYCLPFGYRYSHDERIRRMEEEIERLKGKRQ